VNISRAKGAKHHIPHISKKKKKKKHHIPHQII
jgi:hypothetical protein